MSSTEDSDVTSSRSGSTSSLGILPTIDDFEIIKPISRGAYAKVYLGYKRQHPSKHYAIKVMKKREMVNKNMTSQVLAERAALAVTKSPFVVKLYYSLQTQLNVYLVMDYMIGGDVKSLLSMYGYFDESMAVQYTAEIAMALDYLHKRGIIHRDIKPDNMLLGADGHLRLSDFGLSKIDMDHRLHVKDLLNTPTVGKLTKENLRTPGQLLSLTSQLAFTPGSAEHDRPAQCDWSPNLNDNKRKRCYDSIKQSSPIKEGQSTGLTAVFEDVSILPPAQKRLAVYSGQLGSALSYNSIEKAREASLSVNQPFSLQMTNTSVVPLDTSQGFMSPNHELCSPPLRTSCIATSTSPPQSMGGNAPIPFHLSPNIAPASPLSPVRCASSPDVCTNSTHHSEDSFAQAFTSIKTTDESSSSSRMNILEAISRSDSNLSLHELHSKSFIDGSVSHNNSISEASGLDMSVTSNHLCTTQDSVGLNNSAVDACGTSNPQNIDSASSENETNKENSFSGVGSKPRERHISGQLRTPDQKLRIMTPSTREKGLKKTRFQSIVRSYSASFDFVPLKSSAEQPEFLTPAVKRDRRTPLRTPKSLRKKQTELPQILGTPDYLSPELLLRQPHGPAVDWWALGICLYEFLTGFPPYCDETVEKIFENILNDNMEWPEGDEELSSQAIEGIKLLLCRDTSKRATIDELKQHKLFQNIDWMNLRTAEPQFIPQPDDETDTCYFQPRNQLQQIQMSNIEHG